MKMARLLLGLFIIVVASACSDDKGYDYGDFHYDMVTYLGTDNGAPKFEFQAYDDSPFITLISSKTGTLDMKKGQRILLNYIIDKEESETMKMVTVRGYSKVITDTMRIAATSKLLPAKMDNIKLASIWRTGAYINIRCQVQYSEKPRQLMLIADLGTLNSSMVETYLIHDLFDATAYYWTPCYLSYYAGPAWNLLTCKTLRVNLNDLVYPSVKYYDFSKIK